MVVQWLRLHAITAGGRGSIPGLETKIPHALQPKKKRKKEEEEAFFKQINQKDYMLGTSLVV